MGGCRLRVRESRVFSCAAVLFFLLGAMNGPRRIVEQILRDVKNDAHDIFLDIIVLNLHTYIKMRRPKYDWTRIEKAQNPEPHYSTWIKLGVRGQLLGYELQISLYPFSIYASSYLNHIIRDKKARTALFLITKQLEEILIRCIIK